MKRDIVEQYRTVQASLNKERADLQARLAKIEAALGGEIPQPAQAEVPAKRRRRMSAAGRAAIRAAARARWAAFRVKAAGKAVPQPAPKRKKQFSAAARARLSALAKARWARAKRAGRKSL